jgi:iron-sulfur cluster assembly protein
MLAMAVQLTEKAAHEIQRVRDEQKLEAEMFLRIGIAAGGCSGFNYRLGFDKEFDDKADTRYDCHGVDVVVDKKSALFLDGTTIDWFESIERRGFTFENPNAVKTCGCGSSFQA